MNCLIFVWQPNYGFSISRKRLSVVSPLVLILLMHVMEKVFNIQHLLCPLSNFILVNRIYWLLIDYRSVLLVIKIIFFKTNTRFFLITDVLRQTFKLYRIKLIDEYPFWKELFSINHLRRSFLRFLKKVLQKIHLTWSQKMWVFKTITFLSQEAWLFR